jgi:hypothetical protein
MTWRWEKPETRWPLHRARTCRDRGYKVASHDTLTDRVMTRSIKYGVFLLDLELNYPKLFRLYRVQACKENSKIPVVYTGGL